VLGGAGGAQDVRAPRLGDLRGDVADAAGGRVDQHPLAGSDAGGVDQRLPRGERHERQRGRVGERQAGRLADEVPRRRRDVLGVRAGLTREPRHAEHLVAGAEQRHPEADLLDHARHVEAGDRRVVPQFAAGGRA
jgi:hypothetical protein